MTLIKKPKEDVMTQWGEDIRKASDKALADITKKFYPDDDPHTIYPVGPYMKKVK